MHASPTLIDALALRLRIQRDRLAAELKTIDQALHRVASGNFGRCEGCGDDIAAERLQAQPSARLCLACQKASEQRRSGTRPAP
jgi:RNA polymerase-binding protein DksA